MVPEGRPLRCRVDARSVAGAPLLRRVLADRGWTVEGEEGAPADFNLWWRIHRFAPIHVKHCRFPIQRLNHFSHSHVLTKKSLLAQTLRRMEGLHGYLVDGPVAPRTLLYPQDKAAFPTDGHTVWVCKPVDSSRGRGIFLTRDLQGLRGEAVVQEYITNPLLVNGFKFDLRVYVVVTSFRPLRVYLFEDAIARLCSRPYDAVSALTEEGLGDLYRHLTNASINKASEEAQVDRAGLGPGCKFLWRDVAAVVEQSSGLDTAEVWRRIRSQVIYTCLAASEVIGAEPCCFELFGFDFLVDATGKPWVVEVNFSPDLVIESAADEAVKPRLLAAIVDTLAIPNEGADLPAALATQVGDLPVPESGLHLIFPYDEDSEHLSSLLAGDEDERAAAMARVTQRLRDSEPLI